LSDAAFDLRYLNRQGIVLRFKSRQAIGPSGGFHQQLVLTFSSLLLPQPTFPINQPLFLYAGNQLFGGRSVLSVRLADFIEITYSPCQCLERLPAPVHSNVLLPATNNAWTVERKTCFFFQNKNKTPKEEKKKK
jgi:hypothetical protein